MFDHLTPDFDASARFLRFLDPEAVEQNKRFLFVWMPHGGSAEKHAVHELLTLEEYHQVYPFKLKDGEQPFVTVQSMRGIKRAINEVNGGRAFFLDFDRPPLHEPTNMPPHCIVQSKGGQHWYWSCNDAGDPWRRVEKALAIHFGADLAATDPARIMRMPGSWHLKNPEDPFLVTLAKCEPPEKREIIAGKLNIAFTLDLHAARAVLDKEIAQRTAAWAEAGMPPGLIAFFKLLRENEEHPVVPLKRPGKNEWTFACPMKSHRSAKVVVILDDSGDWTLFCQSGYPQCTRDAILAAYDATWGYRYHSKYIERSAT